MLNITVKMMLLKLTVMLPSKSNIYNAPFHHLTHSLSLSLSSCWGAAGVYFFFMALSGTFVAINFWRAKAAQS